LSDLRVELLQLYNQLLFIGGDIVDQFSLLRFFLRRPLLGRVPDEAAAPILVR